MREEKSYGAIVFREEKGERLYLLLHYAKGHWGFPKGRVEKNETEIATFRRELEEETSLTQLELIPGYREKVSYYFREKGELIYKHVVFFLAKTSQEKISLSFEHKAFEWLPYNESLKRLTFDNTRKILEKAEKILE